MKQVPLSYADEPPECAPLPERGFARWKADLAALFRRNPDKRWGAPLLRIASDLILVCDESLEICHHNRAFLKAIGHTSGTYKGVDFLAFFPEDEREGFLSVFQEWKKGHAAGMRFLAPFLTTRGIRPYEIRVVRCRDKKGDYHFFMIGREAAETRRPGRGDEAESVDPFFRGLPVAAWRTDADLRITKVYGSLWPELGAASEDLVGEVFGRRHDNLLPEVLRGIDCTDTLAGMSLQTELKSGEEWFNVTVEPFLDSSGRVVGTVGMLRRGKPCSEAAFPTGQRLRHHQPPSLPDVDISIVTGRVQRFFEPEETGMETRAIDPFVATRRLRSGSV
jgi:PAS domain S-box-containing protein